MKHVAGASAKTGSQSAASRYAYYAAAFVGLCFFLSFGGNSPSEADSLRSGQAKRPTIHQATTNLPPPPPEEHIGNSLLSNKQGFSGDFDDEGGSDSFGQDSYRETDTELDMESQVQRAENKFQNAIQDELAHNCQSYLTDAIGSRMIFIRENVNSVLGDSDAFDAEQIVNLGNRIEDKLTDRIQGKIQDQTMILLHDKTKRMEVTVDMDSTSEGQDGGGEQSSVNIQVDEGQIIQELRSGVHAICTQAQVSLPHMAAMVEKEVLEYALKKALGRTYVVDLNEEELVTSYKPRSSSSTTHHSSSSGHTSSHHSSSSHHHHTSSGRTSGGGTSSSHHQSSSSHHTSSRTSGGGGGRSSSSHHASASTTGYKPSGGGGYKPSSAGASVRNKSSSTGYGGSSSRTSYGGGAGGSKPSEPAEALGGGDDGGEQERDENAVEESGEEDEE